MPHRAEAERVDQALGLLDRVDVGHDDAERAVVERARAFVDGVGAHPDDGRDAVGERREADLRDLLRA